MMEVNDGSAGGVQPPGDRNNTPLRRQQIGGKEALFCKQQSVFQQILQHIRSFRLQNAL